MIKLTLTEDGASVWVAAWHVELVCPDPAGTKIVLVGQVATYVRENPADVALMVSTRGRPS